MTKKHLNTLINLANRVENLEEDKDLLLVKLKSFLKTLDKHELEELSDDLKQFPEAGEAAALLGGGRGRCFAGCLMGVPVIGETPP